MAELERLLAGLGPCFVVLGNHDFADSRDPFSQRVDPEALALEGLHLLADESITVTLRERRVQIVGVDPRTYARREARPDALVDESVDLRILLCHFPGIVRRIPEVFHVILAGHYHAGQIVVPYPGGSSGSRTCGRATSRASTRTARRACTSRRASAPRSSRSGSSRGRR